MPDTSASGVIRSFGNESVITPGSPSLANQPRYSSVEEWIAAEKRAVRLKNAVLFRGAWGILSPTDVDLDDTVQTIPAAYQSAAYTLSGQTAVAFGNVSGTTLGTASAWLNSSLSSLRATVSSTGGTTVHQMLPAFAGAMSNLRTFFTFRDENAVASFLYNNPSLIPVLRDAPSNISEYFADVSSLVLEVVSDPEGYESDRLFLFIQTHLPSDLAIERLHQLDDEWWLDAIPDDDKMTIDIERL